ncbi:hypothetical protein [Caenimonas soli]|uniref:hypothetical protein n=1 Tax=Caenimonas soli TaxID=2735555 RepID=UPI001554DDCA|nr:hypothetical protein [Caenimonas soli]NPC55938.1 hypothetical protein [Caenimonas soli]
MSKSTPRILQQQPARQSDAQQQQSGSNDFQPKPAAQKKEQQMGEGSYEASRDFKQRAEEYMKKADIEKDAAAAKPRSEEEARELEKAEEEGRSHSKGER